MKPQMNKAYKRQALFNMRNCTSGWCSDHRDNFKNNLADLLQRHFL